MASAAISTSSTTEVALGLSYSSFYKALATKFGSGYNWANTGHICREVTSLSTLRLTCHNHFNSFDSITLNYITIGF